MLFSCSLFSLFLYFLHCILCTTFMFTLDDSSEVRVQLREMRPEYDFDDYLVEGHASIFNVNTMFTILAVNVPIGPTIVLIFIIRAKVLAKLCVKSAIMSSRTAKMHRTLTKVLTLQSVLPVFFGGAVGSYALCQLGVVCSPVQEHFIIE
ncbi:hypothetical protein PMAYCL1PPCAC_16189, partial [Pristionchus mayeri]